MKRKFLISIHKALTSLDASAASICSCPYIISIHKALTSLDDKKDTESLDRKNFNPQGSHEPRPSAFLTKPSSRNNFNPQGSHEPRPEFNFLYGLYSDFNPQGSHEPRRLSALAASSSAEFQSTRLSRASTAKIHNYPCIHAKFIYLNYTPSTNHPASQKIFSYFNPIFRPFAVRIPLEFYVQLLFAPEFPY